MIINGKKMIWHARDEWVRNKSTKNETKSKQRTLGEFFTVIRQASAPRYFDSIIFSAAVRRHRCDRCDRRVVTETIFFATFLRPFGPGRQHFNTWYLSSASCSSVKFYPDPLRFARVLRKKSILSKYILRTLSCIGLCMTAYRPTTAQCLSFACTQWTRKKRGSLCLTITLANLNRFL